MDGGASSGQGLTHLEIRGGHSAQNTTRSSSCLARDGGRRTSAQTTQSMWTYAHHRSGVARPSLPPLISTSTFSSAPKEESPSWTYMSSAPTESGIRRSSWRAQSPGWPMFFVFSLGLLRLSNWAGNSCRPHTTRHLNPVEKILHLDEGSEDVHLKDLLHFTLHHLAGRHPWFHFGRRTLQAANQPPISGQRTSYRGGTCARMEPSPGSRAVPN